MFETFTIQPMCGVLTGNFQINCQYNVQFLGYKEFIFPHRRVHRTRGTLTPLSMPLHPHGGALPQRNTSMN